MLGFLSAAAANCQPSLHCTPVVPVCCFATAFVMLPLLPLLPLLSLLLLLRCGRAARAGRPGSALSLLTRDELPYLLDLHLFLSRQLAPAPLSPEQGLVNEAAAAMAAAGGVVAAAAAAGVPAGECKHILFVQCYSPLDLPVTPVSAASIAFGSRVCHASCRCCWGNYCSALRCCCCCTPVLLVFCPLTLCPPPKNPPCRWWQRLCCDPLRLLPLPAAGPSD